MSENVKELLIVAVSIVTIFIGGMMVLAYNIYLNTAYGECMLL